MKVIKDIIWIVIRILFKINMSRDNSYKSVQRFKEKSMIDRINK